MSSRPTISNVLLVSGGGFQGLALLKGLLRAGHIRVIIADCFEENVCRYLAHRSYVVPRISESGFIDALLDICRKEDIDFVFPCTEVELPCLAAKSEAFFACGVRLAVSSLSFLETVCDKRRLYLLLEEEGLPSPKLVDLAAGELAFPLLGKPRTGCGGRGHLVLKSAKDLARHSIKDLGESYVWQRKLDSFTEFSIDFAISFTGRLSPICVRERVKVSGGFAVIAASNDEASLLELGESFAKMAARKGGVGIFNIQVIMAADAFFISDVNPRMGTSAVFDFGVGVNLPLFVCSPSSETEAFQGCVPAGSVTMVRYLEETFLRREALEGIRAVVFDLDDTLISQKRWILEKLRGILPLVKSKTPDGNLFLVRAMHLLEEGNRSKLLDALCEQFGFSAQCRAKLIEGYRTFLPREAHVFPDVWPVIEELKRRGFQLVILTDNPPASQRQKIAVTGFNKCFDEIVLTQEIKAEKPSTRAFLEVAARLRLSPNELVMVGDNLYRDIEGALQSGYRHAFFLKREGTFFDCDFGIFEELSSFAQRVSKVDRLADLLRYLIKPK